MVAGGEIFYVRTDHIVRPIYATNDLGVKVWEASYHRGSARSRLKRSVGARAGRASLPGQWFQAESGLHQNWMRDYDPTTGRYIQADPLGLVDGASVYGYARQNPGRYVDPRGEFGIPGAVAGAIVGGTAGYLSSGCWQGAISGAIFGAAVGGTGAYLTPAGAAAVGLAAGASGQIAANYSATGCGCSNEEPLPLIELVTSPQFWAISVGSAAGSGFGAAAGSRISSAVGTALFGSGPMYYREGLRNVVEGFVSEGVAGVGGAAGGYGGQILIPN